MDGERDPLRIVTRIINLTIQKSVHAQAGIRPGEWDAQSSLGFWDTNRSPNLGQSTKLSDCQQKKRTCRIVDFVVPTNNRVILKESEERERDREREKEIPRPCSRTKKKTMEHDGDVDTNYNWCTWNNPQRIGKGTAKLGNKMTSWDHPDYNIIKKRSGVLRRLTVTQTTTKIIGWCWCEKPSKK